MHTTTTRRKMSLTCQNPIERQSIFNEWHSIEWRQKQFLFLFYFLIELNSITTELTFTVKLSFASVFLHIKSTSTIHRFNWTVCSVNYSCEIELCSHLYFVAASAYFHDSRAIWIQFSELYQITNYLIFFISIRHVSVFWFFLKIAQRFFGSLCTFSQIDWHFGDSRDFFSCISNFQVWIRNVQFQLCWSGQFIGYCPRHCSIYCKLFQFLALTLRTSHEILT